MGPKQLTWDELASLIALMPPADRTQTALVWPPTACPHEGAVAILNLDKTPDGKPVLSTGKKLA